MTGRRNFVLGLVLFLAFSVQASAAPIQIIVNLSPLGSINLVASLLGGTVLDSIPGTRIHLLRVPSLPLLSSFSLSLLGVVSIETDQPLSLKPQGQLGVLGLTGGGAPDWYKNQPAMQLMKVPQARAYGATGRSIVVADINSAVDHGHPALAGHLTSGYDFVTNSPTNAFLNQSSASFLDQSSASFLDQSSASFLDQSSASFLDQSSASFLDATGLNNLLGLGGTGGTPNAAYSHGTLCAGIIAVVAPESMIMPLRAFDSNGSSDIFTLAKAIHHAVRNGAHVINMSFGTLTNSGTLKGAIEFAKDQNVVLVASAGNNNTSAPQYPAAYSGVISVAATDLSDIKGSFSNYGSTVFVDAPGVNIISAYPNGSYSVVSGTSFSAPAVAGLAALVRSSRPTVNAKTVIYGSAVDIDYKNPNYRDKLGAGRIDALKAVKPY